MIAPAGVVSNTIFMIPSADFNDPLRLSQIANTIRRSILRARDPKFLEPWLATVDVLMRKNARENLRACGQFPNEVIVNSSLRFDWANLVDFGYTNKCRCYVPRASPL
ncbi:unnamed protein product [Rotaria sp. Silwood2]|nr:unnamed protein product [Rotaria sp. Silwood2]CAF4378006.1 unnamed protein product [Rotaria sp. Silwood2]